MSSGARGQWQRAPATRARSGRRRAAAAWRGAPLVRRAAPSLRAAF
jgi:hypothetical protein